MVTEQLGAEPVQSPSQRTRRMPRAGCASSFTATPFSSVAEQLGAQLSEPPGAVRATVPDPFAATASASDGMWASHAESCTSNQLPEWA